MRPILLPFSLRRGPQLAFAVLLGAVGFAGAHRQDPKIFIRFHMQTAELDGSFSTPVRLNNPRKTIYVEKVPSISERDILSFAPYKSADGSYGAAFQLDRHGQLTLQTLTLQKHGGILLATVNGRPITPLAIDKPVSDGIVYVPFGLTEAEIKALGESFKLTPDSGTTNKSSRDPDSEPLAPQPAPNPR